MLTILTIREVQKFLNGKLRNENDDATISFEEFWRQYLGFQSQKEFEKAFFQLYKYQTIAKRNWRRMLSMQAQSEASVGTKIEVEASAEVPEEIKTTELTDTNDNKDETVTMTESELQLEVEKGMDSMKTLLEKRDQNLRLREKNSIFIHDAEERVAEIEKILQSLLEKLYKLKDEIVTCINENAEFERQDACLTISIAVLENKISELQKEMEKRNRLVFILYSWNEQGTIEKLDEYPQYADLEDSEKIYKIQESDRLAQMAKVIELDLDVREELFKNPQILKNIATILRVQEIVGERLVIILENQSNDKEKFIAKILKLFGISIEILN